MTPIVNIIVGVLAILFGRKLFWLLVAIAGFVLGLNLALQFFTGQSEWIILLVALIGGVIGAILAIVLQTVAVGIVGFSLGGYILLAILPVLGLNLEGWGWVVYLVGGIIGAVLALFLFDPALIVLSSLAGAGLIVGALQLGSPLDIIVFVVLAVVGIVVQTGLMRREPPEQRRVYRRRRIE